MINLYGLCSGLSHHYRFGGFEEFEDWFYQGRPRRVQLDIETNVTNCWCDKEIRTVQLGSDDGQHQWVLQWGYLTVAQKSFLRMVLEDPTIEKVIHNAMFECVVFLFHGIRIRCVYDTMLGEMVIHCGQHAQDDDDLEMHETEIAGGFYSLTQTVYRYLGSFMDKSEQMNFGDDQLTVSKVIYAAGDVKPLGAIRRMQLLELGHQDLDWVAALEMEAVLGYAEMTYHGMDLDQAQWLAQLDLAIPIQLDAKRKLDEELISGNNPFRKRAIEKGFYTEVDKWIMRWTNHKKRAELVERFFPFLKDQSSTGVCKTLLSRLYTGKITIDARAVEWIQAFADEDFVKIQDACTQTDRQWLIDNGFILPAGSTTINWDSWQQVLPIFQAFKPKLKSTSKKDMGSFFHPIGALFKEYKDAKKLTTTYGEEFIKKHVEPDGKIRTTYNQIVSTGRISSRKPNLQQIPVREPIGPRYLNCFFAPAGYKFINSDYVSQELVIIAYMSGEKVWNEALKKRQDLHSVCAELVFKKEWEKEKQEGCAYYAMDEWSEVLQKWKSELKQDEWAKDWKRQPRHAKCKCKGHKKLREPTKNLDFGMAYGMSKYKFAGDMRWDVKRAEGVMNDYFRTFPSLAGLLTYLGRFGLNHGYIQTIAPFFRKRQFPDWDYLKGGVDAHIADVRYDSGLGRIERASKNQPIQGTSADITKLAMVMLYWEIHDGVEDLSDRVYLNHQIHDANNTVARDDYADTWEPVLDRVMNDAALYVIPNGLLRAETSRSQVWTK